MQGRAQTGQAGVADCPCAAAGAAALLSSEKDESSSEREAGRAAGRSRRLEIPPFSAPERASCASPRKVCEQDIERT